MTLTTALFSRTLTITPRSTSGTDSYGNPITVDGSAFTVQGALWVGSSRDELADGAVVRSEATAALPAGTSVDTGDRIIDESGRAWEVDGEPDFVWNARTGKVSHLEVALRRGV